MSNSEPEPIQTSDHRARKPTSHPNEEPTQAPATINAMQVMSDEGISCMLVDAEGKILETSSALPPGEEVKVGVNATKAYGLREPLTIDGGPSGGKYKGADGALVPAQLVPLRALTGGELMVLVNDGTPFRDAEALRFERTPYAVFRLDQQGLIRFANSQASRILKVEVEELIGTPLDKQFFKVDGPKLTDAIARCVKSRNFDNSVEVTLSHDNTETNFNLVLTPDLAPNDIALGVLAIMQSRTPAELAREEIRRIALEQDLNNGAWKRKLALVLKQIQPLVRFDHAVFGIYGQGVSLFRAIAAWDEDREVRWPARWMDLPDGIRDFLDADNTCIGDINKFIIDHDFNRTNEVIQCYQDWGINSSVTLPVRDHNDYASSLSLCSKTNNAYGEYELKVLRSLDLEQVLMRFGSERQEERLKFAEALKDIVIQAGSLSKIAPTIIEKLAKHFEWDHVALFRVDRLERCFRLVIQRSPQHDYSLSSEPLPMAEGAQDRMLLDATLEEKDLVAVNDAVAHPRNYFPRGPARELKSAMTFPILLSGRIRWILYVESAQSNAFKPPDTDELRNIIIFLQEGLNHHLLRQTKECLMSETEQAVAFVGREGWILDVNGVAANMFDLPRNFTFDDKSPVPITKYALDDAAKSRLSANSAGARRERLELVGPGGKPRSVLATQHVLDESLDMSIWFFTDIADMEWTRDLRFLREIVADIADETKISLNLACMRTTKIMEALIKDPDIKTCSDVVSQVEDHCDYITKELKKANITFERLASTTEHKKKELYSAARFSLSELLKNVIRAFPQRDQDRIFATGFDSMVTGPAIEGDRESLSAALRSILGYLLKRRIADARIEVTIKHSRNEYSVYFGLTGDPDSDMRQSVYAVPDDALVGAERIAHDDTGLGINTLIRVVRSFRGRLNTDPPLDRSTADLALNYASLVPPWRAFKMHFPTITLDGESNGTASGNT